MSLFAITGAVFSGVSFLGYGLSCLMSQKMRDEFQRYGLAGYRTWVGTLQVVGALGQLVGLGLPWIGVVSSAGLALMMMTGVGVRIKIGDSLLEMIPAAFYAVLNILVALAFAGVG